MSSLGDLYQEVILDHNRSPRNFRRLDISSRKVEGRNPLCGDHLTLYVRFKNDVIEDIGFQGSGCAISTASASLMTDAVKGKTIEKAKLLFSGFHDMVTGKMSAVDVEMLGKLSIFSGVCEFPVRVKCATLAWHTLQAALQSDQDVVSTEESAVV